MTGSEIDGDRLSETGPLAERAHDADDALAAFMPAVYDELRELAAKTLGSRARSLTLQPTALVHEAFIRLGKDRSGWSSRSNFVIAASVAMRRALIDHIRSRSAVKRGGGKRSEADVARISVDNQSFDVLDLEDAMQHLEKLDPEAAQVAQLRVYAGMGAGECAAALDVSTKTVQRRWRFARAWLVHALGNDV